MNQPLSHSEAKVLAHLHMLDEPFSVLDIIDALKTSELLSKHILVAFNNLHLLDLLDVIDTTDAVLEGHPIFLYSLSAVGRRLAETFK